MQLGDQLTSPQKVHGSKAVWALWLLAGQVETWTINPYRGEFRHFEALLLDRMDARLSFSLWWLLQISIVLLANEWVIKFLKTPVKFLIKVHYVLWFVFLFLLSLFLIKPRFLFRLFHAIVFFIVLLYFLVVFDGFVREESQNVLFILFLHICILAALKHIVNRLNQVI